MNNIEESWIVKLVEKGEITTEEGKKILARHRKTGKNVEDLILEEGLMDEERVYFLLSEEWKIPYLNLNKFLIAPEVAQLIPRELAKEYNIVPVFKIGDTLTIAATKSLNLIDFDTIAHKADCMLDFVLSTPSGIKNAFNNLYGKESVEEEKVFKEAEKTMADILKIITTEHKPDSEETTTNIQSLVKMADEAPLIRLVNLIIAKAIDEGASDIHIEPEKEKVRVRYRVDGILREVDSLPAKLQLPIASRIKVMANLDIIEKRKPQDGRISVLFKNREVDLRISILPTVRGAKIVMRILDKSKGLTPLDELGFFPGELDKFKKLIHRPNGIVLITGPTGSGKTSTLYAALTHINSPEINITTLEDPVEYQIEGINQGQVNPAFGLSFADGLRSILRQDPNVILVGEMRDTETAEIAMRASLTGHLVFSTLHTNDAVLAISRLLDMEIKPFLISSSLAGVVAQRLVRKVCPKCKEPYKPSPNEMKFMEEAGIPENPKFLRGKGCSFCRRSGYKGRIGLFELFIISDDIRDMIMEKKTADQIKEVAIKTGMRTLYHDGVAKVCAGLTTLEEVMNVTTQ